ncbi:unnamed protein product, partial [Mesorhabditis spiculigera]
MNRIAVLHLPAQVQGRPLHDQCAQVGPKLASTRSAPSVLIPAMRWREKTKSQIRSHLVIILGACGFLAVVALAMAYVHYRRKKAKTQK